MVVARMHKRNQVYITEKMKDILKMVGINLIKNDFEGMSLGIASSLVQPSNRN